ncbi:hypothetical protein AB0877_11345 [Micromonospora sp. NPDC047644]|uniref:hypothetical protein n=1 Tax=Micromonospora sp. NPDC047644 TaxID=3157203 RepID=UPI0034558F64
MPDKERRSNQPYKDAKGNWQNVPPHVLEPSEAVPANRDDGPSLFGPLVGLTIIGLCLWGVVKVANFLQEWTCPVVLLLLVVAVAAIVRRRRRRRR